MGMEDWAVAIGAFLGVLTAAAAVLKYFWRGLSKWKNFIDDVAGEPARPGVDRRPGLVEDVATLRTRQEEIAVVANTAASDASAVRHELTANGGHSTTKDIASLAAKAAATAAEAAVEAKRHAQVTEGHAARTEGLLRQHVKDANVVINLRTHNEHQVVEALSEHGVEVNDLRPYPRYSEELPPQEGT